MTTQQLVKSGGPYKLNIALISLCLTCLLFVIVKIQSKISSRLKYKSAGLIIIGNEILHGDTKDKNSKLIVDWLNDQNIPVKTIQIIQDDEGAIVQAIQSIRKEADIIITTGGLGTTHDNVTTKAISKALRKKLQPHEETIELLREKLNVNELSSLQKKLAELPAGAVPIPNPTSFAPGYVVDELYALPGFPHLVSAMLPYVGGYINKHYQACHNSKILTSLEENEIAKKLSEIQKKHNDFTIGVYSIINPEDENRCRITLHGHNIKRLKDAENDIETMKEKLKKNR